MNKIIDNNLDTPLLVNDVIFKSLFTENVDILNKMVKDITGYNLDNPSLVCNELPIKRKKEIFKRCDFILSDNNTIINIELNNNYYKSLLIKNTCYIFNLFSTNTNIGDEYDNNLEVIQLNINNFSRFNRPVLDYRLKDNIYDNLYINNIKILDLDIVKCKKLYYSDGVKRNYLKWGALFSATTIEEIDYILDDLLSKKEKYRIMEKLRKIIIGDENMSEAEALKIDDKIRRSIRKEGREEGYNEGIEQGSNQTSISMIKSMIDNNLSYDVISNISNKSIEEIKEIEKS